MDAPRKMVGDSKRVAPGRMRVRKGPGSGLRPSRGAQACAVAFKGDAGAAAELDAGEPAGVGSVSGRDEFKGDDFARFAGLHGVRVGGGGAGPVVSNT